VTAPAVRRTVDLNHVFVGLVVLVSVATLWLYRTGNFPILVNNETLTTFLLLAVEILVILAYERRHRSPLLLVMTFVLVLFYLPRVFSLNWVEPTTVPSALDRLRPVMVDDINEALWFVVLATAAIWLGVALGQHLRFGPRPERQDRADGKPPRQINGRLVFWWLALTLGYGVYVTLVVPLGVGVELRALRFLGLLLNPVLAVVIGLAYVVQVRQAPQGERGSPVAGIIILTGLLAVSQTLFGSRSAILTLVQTMLFLFLAMDIYRIPRRAVVGAGVMLVLAVPIFTVATVARQVRAGDQGYSNAGGQATQVTAVLTRIFNSGNIQSVVAPVVARTAFLDSTVDLIKNRSEYQAVVNLPFYGKSVVDSLTPGFDIFDTPRASNALSLVYRHQLHELRRTAVAYQSDQFNVYGEYHVLFGVPVALFALLVTAWGFQWWLQRVRSADPTSTRVWRYFVVVTFYGWMISFGLDWQIIVGAREAAVVAVVLPLLRRR